VKQKTCRICKIKFDPFSSTQVVCGMSCAIERAEKQSAEKQKKANAKQKREFKAKDKPLRARQAQRAFNAYIRARDNKEPCISCQRFHTGQYHAGHYKTVGGNHELRFEEWNCHKQCAPCNNHLSGNIENYRINLINKIGLELVGWLEGPHELKKYTCEDFKKIEVYYKQKLKELGC